MGKVYKVFKIALRAVLLTVAGILLVYNAYILIARWLYGDGMPKIFGYSFAVVVSGSMADEICIGDFIVTKEQSSYSVGEVITFYDRESGTYITHRIILVSESGYATKGDANNAADDFSVPASAIVGKVVAVIPRFGKAVTFLQSPLGMLSVVGGAAVLWILADIVTDGLRKRKDE